MSILSSATWRLVVIGSLTMDRRYVSAVKKLIIRKNLNQQVELIGPQDGQALASLLAAIHVFIMPFSHEGFGMAYLEAIRHVFAR